MTIVVTWTNATIIRTSGTKLVKGGTVTQAVRRDTTKLVKAVVSSRVIRAAYGIPGPAGQGVPAGGTTGQVLKKASGDDYDTEWVEQTGGGGGSDPIEIVSHESITAGQPIRVRTTTGKGSPAQANAISTADVFGFATNSVGADATIEVTRDRLTVADWTAIAGTEFLAPGQTYFLSPTVAGGIQTTPPTTAGQVVCVVGEALSTTTLAVQIGVPILL